MFDIYTCEMYVRNFGKTGTCFKSSTFKSHCHCENQIKICRQREREREKKNNGNWIVTFFFLLLFFPLSFWYELYFCLWTVRFSYFFFFCCCCTKWRDLRAIQSWIVFVWRVSVRVRINWERNEQRRDVRLLRFKNGRQSRILYESKRDNQTPCRSSIKITHVHSNRSL